MLSIPHEPWRRFALNVVAFRAQGMLIDLALFAGVCYLRPTVDPGKEHLTMDAEDELAIQTILGQPFVITAIRDQCRAGGNPLSKKERSFLNRLADPAHEWRPFVRLNKRVQAEVDRVLASMPLTS